MLGESEKVSREEALRMGTMNNAFRTFEEAARGSMEPGILADFLILSDHLLSVPEDQMPQLHPVATYVGGRKVFATSQGGKF